MATYKMTPAERRARAQSLIQYRENRSLYNNYLQQREAYEKQAEQERLESMWAENEKNNKDFFTRGLSTVGDLVANVLTGAIKGLEGIVDLGIGLVGAVGGIFDGGFQDRVKEIVAYDATGEWIGDPIQEALRYSYLKDGGIIEGVASGIGQMLPAVAVTIATGGAGAPAAVSQIASLATMGVSAAGSATEEAFQEGANYYAGLGYGVASGVIEAATEKMFGGVTKGLTGAGVFDGITKSVADTGIKRIAKSALEEGVEEIVAELANPALKAIYKGSDAFSEYGEGEYWKNVGKAGVIGSMTALAYSGTVGYGLSKMGVGYVGKEADINDSLTEISSLREKATNLQAEDNLEGVNETKIAETTKKNYQNIERVLKSVNETKRASLIKKFSLENVFNADGSFNEQFSAWFNEAPIEAQSSGDGSEEASTPLASPKKTSYSFNLRGNEQTIQDDLDRTSEERAQAYLAEHTALGETLNIEQAREAVGKFAVLSTEMSETARTNRRKFNKALNALNNISGLKTSFVIVESNDTFNATVVDGTVKVGDRMYISADTFEDGSWTGALIHEYTHLEEGSKEYAEMYDFLQSDDILVEVETQEGTKKIPLWQKAQSAVLGKGYGFDQNQIKTISEKVQKGEELTADERKIYNAFTTEVTAHETEYLLGNESFIDKIVAKDSSFAKRLIEKITHLKKAFEKSGEKKTRTELKQLQRAEKLYLNAARKAGDMRLVKFILAQNPELGEEEVDSNAEIRYNRKTPYIQWKSDALAWANTHSTKIGDMRSGADSRFTYFYEAYDPDGDGRATDYRVIARVSHKNQRLINDWYAEVKKNNERNHTSLYESIDEYELIRGEHQGDNGTLLEEASTNGRVGSVHQGESEGDGKRTSQKGNGNSEVRYSLKDTVEQDALSHYGKTYNWQETGYIYADGTRLDLSGRSEGARGGYRTVDHRDIFDIYEDGDDYGTEAMTQFMARGNIRVMPESPGIEIIVEPTSAQYDKILDFVERVGWKQKYFTVDFANENGDNIDSIEYEGAVSARKVVADIKHFFKEGSVPKQSELSKFRYSLKDKSYLSAIESGDNTTAQGIIDEVARSRGFTDEVYHGTERFGFTEFDTSLSDDGISIFASSNLSIAKSYGRMLQERKINETIAIPSTEELVRLLEEKGWRKVNLFEKGDLAKRKSYVERHIDNAIEQASKKLDLSDDYENGVYERFLEAIEGFREDASAENINRLLEVSEVLSKEYSVWHKQFHDFRQALEICERLGEDIFFTEECIFNKEDVVDRVVNVNGGIYKLYGRPGTRLEIDGQGRNWNQIQTWLDPTTENVAKATADLENNRLVIEDNEGAFYAEDLTSLSEMRGSIEKALTERYGKTLGESVALSLFDGLRNSSSTEAKVRAFGEYTTRQISRFAKENGYDSVLIRNISDNGGRSDGRVEKGDIYVYFDSKNLKSADIATYDDSGSLIPPSRRFDTESRDIRYSLKESQLTALEERGVKGDKLLDVIDLAETIESVKGKITEDGKAILFHATSKENAKKIIDSGKMYGKEPNIYFSTKQDGEIVGYGDSIVEAQIPLELLELNDIFDEEVHLTMKVVPYKMTNIRYSLIDDPTAKPYFYELTDGQVKKLLANSTKMKVYSKVESEGIINDILGNYMSFGDSYGTLSGKAKSEVIDVLWRGLNTAEPGRQAKVALDVAEYIIQHSVVESMYDDPTLDVYMDTIALLKPYLHSIDLSHLKGEIKHRYDKDNSVYLLWGKRKGEKGFGADQIALELEELGFHIDAINEADIFFQIDEAYRSAVAHLKREAKQFLSSALSTEERKELKQALAKQILLAFDKNGKPSKLAGILEEYAKKSKVWREKYYEERSKNKVLNRVLDKIQKIKDIKLGTFLNSSQFKNDIFKGSIERLANIKYRGNLNEAGTRNILEGLAEWYVKENPMLQGVFDEDIASMLQTLAKGEGKLTVDELKALENVVDYFKHFIENYNKVYRNGKYVDALPIAEKYVGIVRKNKPAKVGWLRKWFEKYTKTFADPMTLARYMDRYDEGFFTEMLENLRRGAVDASVMEMEMREPLEEFYKKNKKFLKDMTTKTIEYQGKQIPLAQAMLLYMSLNRDQAILGLARSGFTYNDGKETIRVEGFALEEELTIEEVRVRAKEVQSSLASQFTEVEKEYISIAEKLFNETAKEAKRKTDILRRGYSNALEDYYVPIRRANVSQNVDTSTFFDEMNRVSNASFNRDTVRGAKNELFIEALDVVLGRHIKGVALYANLALAIDEYNLLYNLDIGGNPNQSVSVRTENETGIANWSEADAYFKKLISDIQGIPVVKGEGSRFMGWLRGGYAKYQLGANPKVWVTQLSSFAAAGSILDVSSIVKGVGVKASDVDKYCSLAKVRNSENAAALAQGVIEKTGKVGDVLMKPIGMVDRFVVMRLFGACQVQVEKNQGLKVGTEENKVEAGKLLERVILETQQNSMATERSSAMRSGSELMKTITMFSADSMKVIGRVVDSIGEVAVLKAKRKAATDATEIAELDKKIKEANKKARKSVGSLVSSAIFMALIAQAFRWLYAKDDEDENIVHNMGVDAVGNLLGGLPLIRDIYSRFAEGYDFDNYAYSAINDMFDSAESLFTTAGNIIQGDMDSREVASTIKNLLYAAGQIFGIPTRNVYNIAAGLTKRISPSTGYKLDDMFYKQSYRSDLAKAIEKGDEKMIATITGLMLDENIGGIDDSEARKVIDKLVQAGYNVIPRAVSDKITYDGVEYALTPGQVKEFEKVYLVANEALASLVKLPQFKDATDEVKAKAINFIYNVYYNLALQDFLGVDLETKSVLFAEAIDIEKLAIVVATANSLTADLDKKGKVIAGTRKAKVQSYVNSLQLKAVEKYMIMGYLGYTNTKGEAQVKAYINRLKLTKTEKEKLLEYSGY